MILLFAWFCFLWGAFAFHLFSQFRDKSNRTDIYFFAFTGFILPPVWIMAAFVNGMASTFNRLFRK